MENRNLFVKAAFILKEIARPRAYLGMRTCHVERPSSATTGFCDPGRAGLVGWAERF